jgi:hypothetical protein
MVEDRSISRKHATLTVEALDAAAVVGPPTPPAVHLKEFSRYGYGTPPRLREEGRNSAAPCFCTRRPTVWHTHLVQREYRAPIPQQKKHVERTIQLNTEAAVERGATLLITHGEW